ncbi:unnamed protein product [Amoebophrya sp. A25]|nr:unnamed protein product [Amoebophrya sp. A25]|eukprot:GSA25T00005793001.1
MAAGNRDATLEEKEGEGAAINCCSPLFLKRRWVSICCRQIWLVHQNTTHMTRYMKRSQGGWQRNLSAGF